MFYKIFMGSNVAYSTTLIAVAIGGGVIYDSMWDSIWEGLNNGVCKTHKPYL